MQKKPKQTNARETKENQLSDAKKLTKATVFDTKRKPKTTLSAALRSNIYIIYKLGKETK